MKILVVDDSAAMRMLVIRTLRQVGIDSDDVDQAEDGRAALETIRSACPDLVLADWNMPHMTGIELLETLRAEDNRVTFGFITAESSALMRKRANDAGARFLIAKPFSVDAIRKAVCGADDAPSEADGTGS
ncbi:MAG: response regulator [Woeseiaceae bacterium]|nr:response regulator [Woeseiaceae bacterium]